jgi:crotonobetainyl-CoA:carnitine CoA-transferase CaiB-like acyl-CoA transferase
VGEHTAQVLAQLGVEPAEVARLAGAGVIGSAEGPGP